MLVFKIAEAHLLLLFIIQMTAYGQSPLGVLVGSVIQINGTVEFEYGLRTVGDKSPPLRLLVPLW